MRAGALFFGAQSFFSDFFPFGVRLFSHKIIFMIIYVLSFFIGAVSRLSAASILKHYSSGEKNSPASVVRGRYYGQECAVYFTVPDGLYISALSAGSARFYPEKRTQP